MPADRRLRRPGILTPEYLTTTAGAVALIGFIAFEVLAVITVMPMVSRDLDGVGLYALAFAAPFASGVIGMVTAGAWSDRLGPARPFAVALTLFALGLVVCGLTPTMAVLVVGRAVQGLGGGALTVALYVLVGVVYPARLQASVFAAFSVAWVLPALFGPTVAAVVADVLGWRWVFLGVVGLVVGATLLIAPALRGVPAAGSTGGPGKVASGKPSRRLLPWALAAAVAVLAVELLGSASGVGPVLAVGAAAVTVLAGRRLLPARTLRGGRGLPAVIGTRGMMAAAFFSAEAYIVFVLQENWGFSPAGAGIALSVVGIVWATASQLQAVHGERVGDTAAMTAGAVLILLGLTVLAVTVALGGHPVVALAAYAVGGAGMGYGFSRTGVAMLAASTDSDRGFHSSALSIADSLGAALSLSLSGVLFAATQRVGTDPFVGVFALSAAAAALAVVLAARTSAAGRRQSEERR